jgi:CrcB protein
VNAARAFPLVAVGGFIGATARYGVSLVIPPLVSTFAANVVGCFALGYLLYSYRLDGVSERVRLVAATGFLSSFTTYSTFAQEVFTARPAVGVAYVAASYAVGFSAVYAGTRLARRGER